MKKLITMILIMSAFTVYAGGDKMNTTTNEISTVILVLAPTTPSEATFEDFDETTIDINSLKPVTQKEATFED